MDLHLQEAADILWEEKGHEKKRFLVEKDYIFFLIRPLERSWLRRTNLQGIVASFGKSLPLMIFIVLFLQILSIAFTLSSPPSVAMPVCKPCKKLPVCKKVGGCNAECLFSLLCNGKLEEVRIVAFYVREDLI